MEAIEENAMQSRKLEMIKQIQAKEKLHKRMKAKD